MGRQSVLTRKDPVAFHAILDESVMYRPIGGAAVLAEQLRHVVRMSRRPNITVRVMPFSTGTHLALNGSHLLLEFRRQRPIVHLELRRSGVFLDGAGDSAVLRFSA